MNIREISEWVITVAAVLGGLVAIVTITNRYLIRPFYMSVHETKEALEFARTGDERMATMEAELRDLRESVARMTDLVTAKIDEATELHDQLARRDEEIVARLEALTPPNGNPVTP